YPQRIHERRRQRDDDDERERLLVLDDDDARRIEDQQLEDREREKITADGDQAPTVPPPERPRDRGGRRAHPSGAWRSSGTLPGARDEDFVERRGVRPDAVRGLDLRERRA